MSLNRQPIYGVKMNIEEIKKQAEAEIKAELFRKSVEEYKEKLKNKKSLWDIICPFKILIIRKEL